MRFLFHLASRSVPEIHARTATLALQKLRAWSKSGHVIRFSLKEVVKCSISQNDYEYSHEDEEMMCAGHTVVNHFWNKLRQTVDADVHVEDED